MQGMTLEVGYIGRKGLHAQRERNINQLTPGTIQPGSTVSPDSLRPYKGYATIRSTNHDANSFYNGLQVSVTRRYSKGLGLDAAYTYSSCRRNICEGSWDGTSHAPRIPELERSPVQELPDLEEIIAFSSVARFTTSRTIQTGAILI